MHTGEHRVYGLGNCKYEARRSRIRNRLSCTEPMTSKSYKPFSGALRRDCFPLVIERSGIEPSIMLACHSAWRGIAYIPQKRSTGSRRIVTLVELRCRARSHNSIVHQGASSNRAQAGSMPRFGWHMQHTHVIHAQSHLRSTYLVTPRALIHSAQVTHDRERARP